MKQVNIAREVNFTSAAEREVAITVSPMFFEIIILEAKVFNFVVDTKSILISTFMDPVLSLTEETLEVKKRPWYLRWVDETT